MRTVYAMLAEMLGRFECCRTMMTDAVLRRRSADIELDNPCGCRPWTSTNINQNNASKNHSHQAASFVQMLRFCGCNIHMSNKKAKKVCFSFERCVPKIGSNGVLWT